MGTLEQKDKELLANILLENGRISGPLKLMEKRPGTVQTFIAHKTQITSGGPLNKKEQALIGLAVSAAVKADHCMSVRALDAKKEGVNNDEIIQTLLITSMIVGNSLLHNAYEAINKPNH